MADIFNFTDTWGSAPTTFYGIKLDVTNTASAAASRVIDMQVGGVSQFAVNATGQISVPLGTAAAPAFSFGGDTDTGIFSPSANAWAVTVGGLEALQVDASRNVGIGATPGSRLHVSGGGVIVNTTGGAGTSTGRHINLGSVAAPTDWRTYSGSTVAALQMQNSATEGFVLVATVSAATPGTQLITTGGYEILVGATIGGFGTSALRITSTGNLGIGTTDQFGGGVRVVGLANATTLPTTNPTGGGVLYSEGGALKWRGSSGTVTTIAAA